MRVMHIEYTATVVLLLLLFESNQKYFHDLLVLGWGGGGGWRRSGGAKMLGKLSVSGVELIWTIVGQGPTALVVSSKCRWELFGYLFLPLWEMTRYRLKYCLKWPVNQNNQPS